MKPGVNSNEPMVSSSMSLPLPNVKKSKMIFGGADDDVDVCLNCELPASKCRGLDSCYMKHKIKGGGSK